MYARLDFAIGETTLRLRAVLGIKDEYEFVQAFALTIGGFCGLECGIDSDADHIIASIASGFILGTLFFLTVIALTAIFATIFTFIFYLNIGRDLSLDLPGLSVWSRGLRVALSLAVSGFVTLSVFNFLDRGVREMPILGARYASFLYDRGDLNNVNDRSE